MGCASSKQPVCRNCQAPVPRSYSMHVHHPPQRDGDTYHVVALTSTTLGSLKLDPPLNHHHYKLPNSPPPHHSDNKENADDHEAKNKDFSMGVIEAKTWSKMIEEKIPKIVPKTPITTPPGEPETINAWELMEGLDDTSPLRPPHHLRSFSFHVSANTLSLKPKEDGEVTPKPIWHDNESITHSTLHSTATSIVSDFDPDVITEFRKSLEELPPANPFHLKPLCNENEKEQQAIAGNNDVLEVTSDKKLNRDKLVLYFTSLRGVRKTYEDCCHVKVILKGVGVRLDERDVSMHSGFKEEMKELMGDGFNAGGLPRVFVGRKYIGGAEEIRRMHEEGQLEKVLEGCEMLNNGCGGGGIRGGGGDGVCEACGDIRFMPCETCSGSCRIYYEGDYDDDEECDEGEFGFQRCPDCNENGLIRCPICCD
ncbi:hypothetical protein RJ639_030228 [Escallonia herrerae]|uniref:Glutaredoxin domain-containing protein n=1 Tax=Escallonia herrerae TaxID=1293975 RepID=A0AA89BAZ2_9ASTE|nr:hypothetical protein RJ639_030228 [Escallonia herrerae]